MKTDPEQDTYFGFRFLVNLKVVLPLLFNKWDWVPLLAVLIVIANGTNEYIAYHSGTIIGKFYQTLLMHDEHQFWIVFMKASGLYIGQTLLIATGMFFSWLLSVFIRKNLTRRLHQLYFAKKTYYELNHVDNHGMDNPDQRISQDAEKMTTILASKIVPYLLISPGVVGYYTYKTWSTAGGIGVGCVYLYFLIGTIVNRILVSPITKWTVRLERAEGNFRYKHVSVRDNAEETAFYDGEKFESFESDRMLDTLLHSQLFLALWKYPAQYFQTFFDYYGGVLTYAIQIIPIFILNSYKDLSPAELANQISNNAFVYIYLINSFTRLTDLAMNIGELAGYCRRIADLTEFATTSVDSRTQTTTFDTDRDNNHLLFKADNLTFAPPDSSKEIIKDLSLEVPSTKSLLITGASGVGKTSLLRIIKQLWEPLSGSVQRFASFKDMIFLPQRSYLPVGRLSLRQQLAFPKIAEFVWFDDNEIVKVLEALSLGHLIALCGNIDDQVSFEWRETLSPGEQQRLSIARILLQKPKFALLDESTSNLSFEMEDEIYNLLRKNGIAYVSTGHRTSLTKHHDFELKIGKSNKDWKLINLPHEKE